MTKKNNSYVKSILLLTSGSVFGQVIGFIGSMIMTRFYTSSEIGIMTTVVSVSGMFAPVINGRFDFAIVKESNMENVYALIKLSIVFGVIASIIVSLGFFPYFGSIEDFISPWTAVLFVFLILIIQAFSNVFKSYNNNIRDYKTMTSVIVLRRLAEELSMFLFGLCGMKSIGLLVSRVIGQYFGMNREVRNIKRHVTEIIDVKKQRLREVYNLHKRQLYFSTPAALMNAGSYSLVNLLIGKFFGLDNLGVYAISFAVLGLPLSVISANVSKVYFGEASKEYSTKGDFSATTKRTLIYLFVFSIFLFVIMYYIFPLLVPIIYGAKYAEAGWVIRVLAPMFAIRFISSALNTGFVVSNRQNFEFIIQILFLISIVILAAICFLYTITMYMFLIGVSVSYAIIYALNLYLIYFFSKKQSSSL